MKERDSLRHFLSVRLLKLMRGTDLDTTLSLLSRIVCEEVVIMARLDL